MGYPRKRDAMPDEWLDCEKALQEALYELGMSSVVVEARSNGTPGGDLLLVSFGFFVMLVDFYDGKWVVGLPSIGGEGKEWFGDLTFVKHVTPRMLAIQVVFRAKFFFLQYLDVLAKLPAEVIAQMPQEKGAPIIGSDDQVLFLELNRAEAYATTLGHWSALGEGTSAEQDEDNTLNAVAQILLKIMKKWMVEFGIEVPWG